MLRYVLSEGDYFSQHVQETYLAGMALVLTPILLPLRLGNDGEEKVVTIYRTQYELQK